MSRELTENAERKIAQTILAGDRVEATSIYIRTTECGLGEAQQYIKSLTAHLKATVPGDFKEKTLKEHWKK